MATLETITSASTPTLKPVKYVTEGYNSIKFVGVATYREFLEDVKETSRIVIEVSFYMRLWRNGLRSGLKIRTLRELWVRIPPAAPFEPVA